MIQSYDERNTAGNITLISISGPGLPENGVPAYDVNDNFGTGTAVDTITGEPWIFVWRSSTVRGIERLQTARYYFTARDSNYPEIHASTSVVLKKPDFYATIVPNPASAGSYVQLTGNAERGISYTKIDVLDSQGKALLKYVSPVSGSGYFNFGFHADMAPGQYTITVSNPAMKAPLRSILTVDRPAVPVNTTSTAAPVQ